MTKLGWAQCEWLIVARMGEVEWVRHAAKLGTQPSEIMHTTRRES